MLSEQQLPMCRLGEFAVQTCFLGRYGEEIGSDQFGATIMVSTSDDKSNGDQRSILRLSNIEVRHCALSLSSSKSDPALSNRCSTLAKPSASADTQFTFT